MVLTECSGCAWNRGGAYVSAVMVKVVDAEPELLVEASTGAAVEQQRRPVGIEVVVDLLCHCDEHLRRSMRATSGAG